MTGYAENSLVRGLSFLAEKQAAIANNLANVNTTSFKRRMAVAADSGDQFHTLLDQRLSAVDFQQRSDLEVGAIRETGNRLDIALEGSNVDSLQELVAMITVERSFSATQRVLKGVNQLQENMITQMLR